MAIGGSGDSITLDRTAFKALASETRVEILKQLDASQKTVSDLARDMNMNKATMFQHLEQLVDAGLVKKDSEEDRATTVKTAPLEAPVAGPPKKWVYYRLTGKGKNLLHPERVKIAVLLSVVAISCIMLAAVFTLVMNSAPPPGGVEMRDLNAPDIISWSVDEVGQSTRAVGVNITVGDNATGKPTGIDPDSIVVRWGVGSSPSGLDPNLVQWQQLPINYSGGVVSASVPDAGWANFSARFLYLSLELKDRAGNSATYVEHRRIAPGAAPDLMVSERNISLESQSYKNALVQIVVSNTGTLNATNVTVAVYISDPDPSRTGVAVSRDPLQSMKIAFIPAGGNVGVSLTIYSSSLPRSYIFVMVDPDNTISETDETNNVARSRVPESVWVTPPAKSGAGMGAAPGFEGLAVMAVIGLVLLVAAVRRRLN